MTPAPKSFYEVVVVGGSLGALVSGALLARRGFRVLWIRHDDRPHAYVHAGVTLRRGPAALTVTETPVFRRVMSELALLPIVRRRAQTPDPVCQVVLPAHRVDVGADHATFLAELRREFPELERPMTDFYERLARATKDLDGLLGSDIIWPPRGFFERREANAAVRAHLHAGAEMRSDPLADFPHDHPLRTFEQACTRPLAGMDPDALPPIARLRLHAAATRHGVFLEGGRDGLLALLIEKIEQHGGAVLPRERASRVHVERGRVRSVEIDGSGERFGCKFVVTSLDAGRAIQLAQQQPSDRMADWLLSHPPQAYRFVTNVVLRAEGVPSGLGSRAFVVFDRSRPLAEENLLYVETARPDDAGRVVLTACMQLPRSGVDEGASYLGLQRERMLRAIMRFVPFVDRNLLGVDSPHDGRMYDDRVTGLPEPVEARWRGEAEPMEAIEAGAPDSFLGVCPGDVRLEIDGMLCVAPQVAAGFAEEGELLAAVSAARLVTASDRLKSRLRRELWSKVES